MKGKGWLIGLAITNIAFAGAFAYTFYCERRAMGLLKAIKKDNTIATIRPEYQDYWKTIQPA